MKKEFDFDQAQRVGNRFRNAEVKVTITARIDPEVLAWLKKEAERRGIPYQTLMNSLLKEAKEGQITSLQEIRRIIREELDRRAASIPKATTARRR